MGLGLAAIALLLLVSASPATARPNDRPKAADSAPVEFTVTVVHATRDGSGVDRALKHLARYFGNSFKRYDGFRKLDGRTGRVAFKGAFEMKLPDATTLKLEHQGVDGKFVNVKLGVGGLKTTMRVRDGGLFFQAGRSYRNGILVLAIKAKTTR